MYRFTEIKVSAPSKIILFGEHAVVYGKTAIAASLGLRTKMRIKPHKSRVLVNFPDVGLKESWEPAQLRELFKNKPTDEQHEVDVEYLEHIQEFLQSDRYNIGTASVICFLYLYSVIMERSDVIPMEIIVESEIPLGAGLGSSAALSVCLASGLMGVLHQVQGAAEDIFNNLEESLRRQVCDYAFLSEKILHGNPSGIDNSISTYGGLCKFQQGNLAPVELSRKLRILLVNTNIKRNTKELVARVRERKVKYPEITEQILQAIESVSQEFLSNVDQLEGGRDELHFHRSVGDLVECNQGLLSSLGVSHPALDEVCGTLTSVGISGKLTGAGGGGFAIAVISPFLPEKSLGQAVSLLESKGYTCTQADIGVGGFQIEKL